MISREARWQFAEVRALRARYARARTWERYELVTREWSRGYPVTTIAERLGLSLTEVWQHIRVATAL
jgi:DNA-binding NarL/FixJ family response regulator